MSQVIVDASGIFLKVGSQLFPLEGIARLNANGSVTVRFPARDVTVVNPPATGAWLDCTDFDRCLIAVVFGGVPLSDIQAIRPAMAAAVQTYMTNHGLTAGSVD